MTQLDNVLKKDWTPESLPEIESHLLKATHDLAAALGVEPHQALNALATVVRRRADFERLRGAAKASLGRIVR